MGVACARRSGLSQIKRVTPNHAGERSRHKRSMDHGMMGRATFAGFRLSFSHSDTHTGNVSRPTFSSAVQFWGQPNPFNLKTHTICWYAGWCSLSFLYRPSLTIKQRRKYSPSKYSPSRKSSKHWLTIYYARKQLCFQRVLAIAILSVRLSVCHTGGSGKNGPS